MLFRLMTVLILVGFVSLNGSNIKGAAAHAVTTDTVTVDIDIFDNDSFLTDNLITNAIVAGISDAVDRMDGHDHNSWNSWGNSRGNSRRNNRAIYVGDDQTDEGTKTALSEYKDFQKIEITGVYEIRIVSGADFDVKLSGNKAALARANVSVKDNTLYLGHIKRRGIRGKKTIRATVALPMLTAIQVSGVVDGHVQGIDAENFTVEVSGVGDLTMEGACGRLVATLSGVGDLNARNLKCNAVDVVVSGVGDAKVYATQSLNARVSGLGDLTCYGSPREVRKNRNFFSSIRVH